ncbi:vitellogenin-3-like [Bradysia coprophila]|uniref:vitellogenin-3-like n=1 Tax=Bradysia coprophila TaxID=38358 RepID=UPI00187D721A|nr:vitellogenin-3-like [Bradysia coprophila]
MLQQIMKWSCFLALISIGLVAGEGAWKHDHEYKYRFVYKTFLKEPTSKILGFVSSVGLTIHPQTDRVLIGRITDASSKILTHDQTPDERDSVPTFVPIGKQFKFFLKNGVIDSLSVDRTLTTTEINRMKLIVSQFQVDTKAENVIESMNNHLPDANTNNALYTTMETTVSGTCETSYDISRLPEYLAYANYGSIASLSRYAVGDDVIEIKKHINTKNCEELTGTDFMDIVSKKNDRDSIVSRDTRIIITGSLDKYIIHSSEYYNQMLDINNYVYLSLESLKRTNDNSDYTYGTQSDNMLNIGNLVYQ